MTNILGPSGPLLERAVEGQRAHGGESNPIHTAHSGLPLIIESATPALPQISAGRRAQMAIKRALDITTSLSALIILLPFLILVVVLIRSTSKGPALIHQIREGRDGKPIGIYKFRTMHTECCDISGVQQTVKDDPRITPLGRILRKRNIDELPQLLNVLLGHMSLVGPRPHVYGQLAVGKPYRELVPYYDERHRVMPGLTGWAQANGFRGPTDDPAQARARIDHDLAYIANFSLWLDIKIMLLTLSREFRNSQGF